MSKLSRLQDLKAADEAWKAEVEAQFGSDEAGLARYQGRATGEPGSRLRALHDQYERARKAYDAA